MVFKGAVSHILHQRLNKENKAYGFQKILYYYSRIRFRNALVFKIRRVGVTIDNLKIGLISEIMTIY